MEEICFQSASGLVEAIRSKELSALEVMDAHISRIEQFNPKINAIVTMDLD